MQIFFKDTRFSKYANNTLAIWTESYGGHYGPNIANYFLTQNAAIRAGTVSGVIINLQVRAWLQLDYQYSADDELDPWYW